MDEPEVAYVVAFCEIGIYVCYLAGQLHSKQLFASLSRHILSGSIIFCCLFLYLLDDCYKFGTFLSLKSVLIEIGKWAQKVMGGRGRRFHDCLVFSHKAKNLYS